MKVLTRQNIRIAAFLSWFLRIDLFCFLLALEGVLQTESDIFGRFMIPINITRFEQLRTIRTRAFTIILI